MNKSFEVGVHEDYVVLKIVGHHHVSAFVVRTTNIVYEIFISKIVCFIQTDVYMSKVETISRDLSPLVVHAHPQMKHSSL